MEGLRSVRCSAVNLEPTGRVVTMALNADYPTGMRKLFICRVVSILDMSVHYVAGLRMVPY